MSVKSILAAIVLFITGLGAGYLVFSGEGGVGINGPVEENSSTTLALKNNTTGNMNEAAVRRIVEAYIVENPTVILASLDDYQRNGFLGDIETRAGPFVAHLENLDGASVVGPADPEVKIIEFFDYQCPHCKANYSVLRRLLDEDPTIALMPKHLPILGDGSASDMSLFGARAAEAARLQGKFAAFHEGLMAREAPLTRSGVLSVAEAIGLDMNQFNVAVASDAVAAAVEESRAIAQDIGIMQAGTPGYIIGGKVMIGAAPDAYERLKAMVEAARETGG